MNLTVETVEWGGWKNNLRLTTNHLELIITLDVGPRIIYLAPRDANSADAAAVGAGTNLFHVFADEVGQSGESGWKNRGGHRIWIAPEVSEDDPMTYFPDNSPVEWEDRGGGRILLKPPVEEINGLQKEIELHVHAEGAHVDVTHRISNVGQETRELAPWALSVMAAGGTAIVPQPPLGSHPADLQPNRVMVLWAFTDLKDPRLNLGSGFITLKQDASRGPIKVGLAHRLGWIGYALNDVLFVKHFDYKPDAVYADLGCNCELFTNEAMLEVESLGPLRKLAPGETLVHEEKWHVYTGLASFDVNSESSIASALKSAMPSLGGAHS